MQHSNAPVNGIEIDKGKVDKLLDSLVEEVLKKTLELSR